MNEPFREQLADPDAFTPWPHRTARTAGRGPVTMQVVAAALVVVVGIVWLLVPHDSIVLLLLAPVGVALGAVATRGERTRSGGAAAAGVQGLGLEVSGDDEADAPAIASFVRALRSVGIESFRCVAVGHGAAWAAAPDASVVVMELGRDETRQSVSGILVPLPIELIDRYAGITIEFGGRVARTASLLAVRGSQWSPVSFERSDAALGLTVRAHPEQDPVAVHELIDPPLLLQLAAVARSMTGAVAVIATGSLVVLEPRDVFGGTWWSSLAGQVPDPDPLARLAAALHRRILETWT